MIYFSYCVISINNILLVMICESFLEISGFLRNKFNLQFLFNFLFCFFFAFFSPNFNQKNNLTAIPNKKNQQQSNDKTIKKSTEYNELRSTDQSIKPEPSSNKS
jgi:hypothetical protein